MRLSLRYKYPLLYLIATQLKFQFAREDLCNFNLNNQLHSCIYLKFGNISYQH